MSELHLILKSFSKKDMQYLQEHIAENSKKGMLLNLFNTHPNANDSFFAEKLGYDENSSSFATLKHRFIDEIADILFEKEPNPIVKINQRVAVLRSSIYSAHGFLFEHELNRCCKTAKRLEAFEARYQILKLKLVYAKRRFQSETEISKIEKELDKIQQLRQIVHQVETIFFSNLFAYNINLFHIDQSEINRIYSTLKPIEKEFGNLKTIKFLIQSLKLDMSIKSKKKLEQNIGKQIDSLILLYDNSSLHFKYPLADIGLYAMKNKSQFLTNHKNEFDLTFQHIWKNYLKVVDKHMYLGVNIYLLFIINYQFHKGIISKNDLTNSTNLFERSKHPLIQTAVHFFQACEFFNMGHYTKAYTELIKSRQYVNVNIRKHTIFPLEICILAILCQLKEKEPSEASLNYEINAIKYSISKMKLSKKHPVFLLIDFTRKTIKGIDSRAIDNLAISNIVTEIQSDKLCLLINQ